MKVLTIITSFNRKESLTNLLTKLDKQETDIIIYDDCSDFKLDRSDFIQLPFNYGKEYAWLKFKLIFADLKKNYDYYIFIPDDVDVSDNFINDCVYLWERLQDKDKICLSLLTDGRVNKPNWTNFKPIIQDEYIKTQWNDLCFISNKEFFNIDIQPISLKRWVLLAKSLNMELGSGLGGQISRYWHDKGKTMYHTKESQVKHLSGVSMMNPLERLVNPL
jgi:hypothetical protein